MRLRPLDVLRGIAVLLVMWRHAKMPSSDVAAGVRVVAEALQHVGWMGVDLFFALSGFLVSGLLFAEYQRYGSPARLRFWVRRGFKIYPSFALFLLVGWYVHMHLGFTFPGPPRGPQQHLYEALFVRNLYGGLWAHTWSLDIEEHFYLLLPLLLTLLALGSRPDPFRWTWIAIPVLAVAVLAWRWLNVGEPFPHTNYLYPTQYRLDSLLWGVALAYVYHYRDRAWLAALSRSWPLALAAVVLLLAPGLFLTLGASRAIATWGLTTIALGCTLLVALALAPARAAQITRLGTVLAAIGVDSYSIYLWHLPVKLWVMPFGYERVRPSLADPTAAYGLELVVYFAAAIALGVGMARLVERPALALRERLIPSRARPLEVPRIASELAA